MLWKRMLTERNVKVQENHTTEVADVVIDKATKAKFPLKKTMTRCYA